MVPAKILSGILNIKFTCVCLYNNADPYNQTVQLFTAP